jgi:hypothetical protein
MLTKIYAMIWVVVALIAAAFFLTGNFTPVVGVVFGFILFGMIFLGILSVLPSTVGHNAPAKAVKHKEPKPARAAKETKKTEGFPATTAHAR